MTTTETDTAAAEPAAPATTATDAAETATAGTVTPGERDSGSQPQDDAEHQDAEHQDADSGEPRGRAAAYRKRAQEAEAKAADAEARAAELAGNVERLQRLQVEQAATAAGIKPAALWAVAELADLLDDAGLPDAGKVSAAAKAAHDQLGIQRPTVADFRTAGLKSGAGVAPPKRDGWADAFRPRDN